MGACHKVWGPGAMHNRCRVGTCPIGRGKKGNGEGYNISEYCNIVVNVIIII